MHTYNCFLIKLTKKYTHIVAVCWFISSDNRLDLDEFRLICKALFRNDRGKIYGLEERRLKEVFETFDVNDDGFIDKDEFTFCWNHWIKTVGKELHF